MEIDTPEKVQMEISQFYLMIYCNTKAFFVYQYLLAPVKLFDEKIMCQSSHVQHSLYQVLVY